MGGDGGGNRKGVLNTDGKILVYPEMMEKKKEKRRREREREIWGSETSDYAMVTVVLVFNFTYK